MLLGSRSNRQRQPLRDIRARHGPAAAIGNRGALSSLAPMRRFHARITVTVECHRGTVRCLRPLPVRWTAGAVSRIRLLTRRSIISETRAPVL